MRGWRRIGVVLSVIWFIGFGFWLRNDDNETKWKMSGHYNCYTRFDIKREGLSGSAIDRARLEQLERELKLCQQAAVARFRETVSPDWAVLVTDAVVLALLWLLAWMIVAVGRWVAAGFRQQA